MVIGASGKDSRSEYYLPVKLDRRGNRPQPGFALVHYGSSLYILQLTKGCYALVIRRNRKIPIKFVG